jgi:hypothetical protein
MPVPDIGYCDTLGRPLTFDGGSIEGFAYTEGTTEPAASNDVALSGSYSLKCTIPSGTTNGRSLGEYADTTGSVTQTWADGTSGGNLVWFAFDIYVADFTAYDSYNSFCYWSHGGTIGTSGMFLRPVQNTSNWDFVYNGGSNSTGSLGSISMDTWVHWTFSINFSSTNTVGEINVWKDGSQIVTALKPSAGTYDETQGASTMNWRVGFNRNTANTSLQTAYYDNIAVGTTRASVEDVGPTPAAILGTTTMPSGWATRNASLVIGGTSKQGIWV